MKNLQSIFGVVLMVLLLIGAVILFFLDLGGITDAISFMMGMMCIIPPLALIKEKKERR